MIITDIRKKILECLKKTYPEYVTRDIIKNCVKLDDNVLESEVQYLEIEDCIELRKTKEPNSVSARITFTGVRALSNTDYIDY